MSFLAAAAPEAAAGAGAGTAGAAGSAGMSALPASANASMMGGADKMMGVNSGTAQNMSNFAGQMQGQNAQNLNKVQQGMQMPQIPQSMTSPVTSQAPAQVMPGQVPSTSFSDLYRQYRGM